MTALPADVRAWPEAAIDELREREAIVEYLGKQPRARAERMAEEMVRRRFANRERQGPCEPVLAPFPSRPGVARP